MALYNIYERARVFAEFYRRRGLRCFFTLPSCCWCMCRVYTPQVEVRVFNPFPSPVPWRALGCAEAPEIVPEGPGYRC